MCPRKGLRMLDGFSGGLPTFVVLGLPLAVILLPVAVVSWWVLAVWMRKKG